MLLLCNNFYTMYAVMSHSIADIVSILSFPTKYVISNIAQVAHIDLYIRVL